MTDTSTLRLEQVAREDVLLFVNAAVAATAQREFSTTRDEHVQALEFVHEYMLVNYRELYAATLALGINDHNAAQVIVGLLKTGNEAGADTQQIEGRLIAARLRTMPPPRVYRLFGELRALRVNNRRVRAIIRDWVSTRPDLAFDAVKYRRGLTVAVRHAHLRLPPEIGEFLFGRRRGAFENPLLDAWRRAHYQQKAIYELPFTVAEGFAARQGVSKERFRKKISSQLTVRERARLHNSTQQLKVGSDLDLSRLSLTRLASYVLSLPRSERSERRDELDATFRAAAGRVVGTVAGTWGRTVTVLDDSYSASGSAQKPRRPLAVALSVYYLAEAMAADHHGLWLHHRGHPLLVHPIGATNLGERILDALALHPDRLLVVSDGAENNPPGLASQILQVWHRRIDPATRIMHLNPVYDPSQLDVRWLAPTVPSVGIRDGEDVPALVEIARFATGDAKYAELVTYLEHQVAEFLGGTQ